MSAVPNRRLSYVTPQDQQQFAQLFMSALKPGETAMDGDTARVVLMRSQLPTNLLGDIWQLCDTTRSGTLMFPEFCLAMSLCGSVRRGEPLPRELHPGLLKEISDLVDQISFNIPDSQPNDFDRMQQQQAYQQPGYQQPQQTGYSGFQQPQQFMRQATGGGFPSSQYTGGFQPQATGFSQISTQSSGGGTGYQPQTLQAQATGGYQQPLQSQITGSYQQPLQSQMTGGYQQQPLQSQVTGGYQQPLQSQITGVYQQQQPLQSQITGGYQQQPLQSQITGGYQQQQQPVQSQVTGGYPQPLQSQTTGGYSQQLQSQVTGGGLQAQGTGNYLQSQSTGNMPLSSQPTGKPGQWGFSNAATPGIENFVGVFTAGGQQQQNMSSSNNTIGTAISKTEKQKFDEIFAQWDVQRSGFITGAAAIENFSKSGLSQPDLEQIWALSDPTDRGRLNRDEFAVAMHLIYRRLNGYDIPSQLPPELLPPSSRHLQDSLNQVKQFLKNAPTGSSDKVSYLKSTSFGAPKPIKKDATVFKNDDNSAPTYKSANRHKAPPKPERSSTSSTSTLSELAKAVKEKKIILEALDAEDEEDKDAQSSIDRENTKAIEELKIKISNVQKDLDAKPQKVSTVSKRELVHKLEGLTDALPQLTMSIRKIEQDIAVAKVEVVRKKYERDHPGFQITGTGPGGEVTESDRNAARRKAELRARMSAITGRQLDGANSFEEFEKVILQASQSAAQDRETHEQSLRALEESVRSVKRDLSAQLHDSNDQKLDRDRRRWEEAVGVEPQVKEFIESLRPATRSKPTEPTSSTSSTAITSERITSTPDASKAASPAPGAKETAAERVARIRAEAERRTRERFAKAGIQMRGKRESPQPAAVTAAPACPEPELKPDPKPVQAEVPKQAESAPAQAKPDIVKPKQVPNSQPPAATPPQLNAHDSDSEDEEELRIQRENEEMQRRIKAKEEEARARKAAKAERLAELKRQQEEMRLREASISKDDSDHEGHIPVSQKPRSSNPFGKREPSAAAPPQAVEPVKYTPPAQKEQPATQPQATKVALPLPTAPVAQAPVARAPAPNPFGPHPTVGKNDDDDDWGSDNDDSDDEAGSGRTNAAQLASMLFGTMGGANRQATESPQVNSSQTNVAASQKAPAASMASSSPAPIMNGASTVAPSARPAAPPLELPAAPQIPTVAHVESPQPVLHHMDEPAISAPPPPPLPPVSHVDNSLAEPSFSAPPPPPAPPVAVTSNADEFNFEEPSFSAPPPPPPPPMDHLSVARDEDDEFVSADEGFDEDEFVSHPPASSAPPAPPSAPPAPPSAPPAPPSAPPAPPTTAAASETSAPAPPAMGGGFAALLGDITKGTSLRKVDPSQQKVSGGDLGRVL